MQISGPVTLGSVERNITFRRNCLRGRNLRRRLRSASSSPLYVGHVLVSQSRESDILTISSSVAYALFSHQ